MRSAQLARFLSWSGALILLTGFALAVDGQPEIRAFPASPGDTVVVRLDYGRVIVRPAQSSVTLTTRLTKRASDVGKFRDIEVLSQKQGNKIYLSVYFYEYRSEMVSAEIWAPSRVNLIVWGANPDVDVTGSDGYVNVHTLTGSIKAEDLTASTSLMTDTGDITLRMRRQPQNDLRLETVSGNVTCELKDDLNFRGWARAGKQAQWNDDIEKDGGSIERQIGLGGPLCYAVSLNGRVEFKVKPNIGESAAAPAPPVAAPPEIRRPAEEKPQTQASNRTAPSQPEPAPDRGPQTPAVKDSSGTYDTGYKLKVDVDWVYLNASVRERSTNRSVPNLQKEDFLLYEDGARQNITRFMQTEAPFHLLLLLDVSGSTQDYLDMIKEASAEFVRQLGPDDRVAIATFNSSFRLRQDFTSDRQAADQAIRRIRSGGGTAFYDALLTSVRNYIRPIEGRKAIVVFSDGVDNQLEGNSSDGSTATFPQLYREIQEADALIYTIFLDTQGSSSGGTPTRTGGGIIDILGDILRGGRRGGGGTYPGGPVSRPGVYREAKQQMEEIADQTGARTYAPNRIEDLANAYSEIADDLRIQYTLGYNSSNPDTNGSFRRLSVSIANRTDLVVRTRKGYYAKADATKQARAKDEG